MAQKVKLLEAFSEFTIRGFSRFVGQMQRVKRLASVALAPFRMLGRVIRMAFSPLNLMLGGAGILIATRGLLKLASTAEETQAKFETVFKEESAAAEKFVQSVAKATGRYTVELRGYMASLQDTFVPLGFARAQARKMSEGITQLALDVASFNPEAESTERVLGEMKSALTGNIEAVRKYGIVISEVTMKEVMLKMGYKGSYTAASAQLKILARLKIMYNMTADAQGDLARTGDSYKNTIASMWAQLKRLGEGIGTVLIPAFKALGELVSALAGVFSETATGRLREVKELIKGISQYVSDLAKQVKAVKFGDWWGAIKTAILGLKDMVIEIFRTLGDMLDAILERAADKIKNAIRPDWKVVRIPLADALDMHAQLLSRRLAKLSAAMAEGILPGKGPGKGPGKSGEYTGSAFDMEIRNEQKKAEYARKAAEEVEKQFKWLTSRDAAGKQFGALFKSVLEGGSGLFGRAIAKMFQGAKEQQPKAEWVGAAGLQQRLQEKINQSQEKQVKLLDEGNKERREIKKQGGKMIDELQGIAKQLVFQ